MKICKSILKATSVLTSVSAVLWLGSAGAAPLPPSYSTNSAALFASVMQDQAAVEENDSSGSLAPRLQRQIVNYGTRVAAGTIVIDTAQTYLYYVLGDGKAIRYGIGVGRDGFTWGGAQSVTRMAEWPDWTPPQEMIARQPYLPRWMAGGKGNPLGARAIYLGSTVYRIHGTNAPTTIGTKVSSGCIRLTNADVSDLYSRVTVGTKIIVLTNQVEIAPTTTSPLPASQAAPRIADVRATGIY
jgi:lipoprotein-anchoring transpeptidase ErfK/SrfK